jgi:tetratricopeptide (TPR) repeat protein
MSERARQALVPAIPAVFSLLLSALTVGTTVFWQDSGLYLVAVHEMSTLYPHGFALYQALCKAWTLAAAPIFGFALSVHLFSAVCAAAGAAFTALAARDFLKRVEPSKPAEIPAILAGCVLAAGYCYGHAAIIAKCYALFTALLAAVLWLLVRAERKGEFLAMGAVLGLSWAAHPSAALLLPAMIAFTWARRDKIREWGWGFTAAVAGIAIASAFLPSLLLPVLAARESISDLGNPRTAKEVVKYLIGERYTSQQSSFALEGWRWISGARYTWEEYLGGGALMLAAGAVRLYQLKKSFLLLLAAWVMPVIGVTMAFRAEGQFDQWLVAAFVPLALLVALGFSWTAERGRAVLGTVAAVALGWLVVVNVPLLNQRGYDWAEQFGRLLLKNLDPKAVVLFSRDDPYAIARYLQVVRGERPDVSVISSAMLGQDWLDRRIQARYGLGVPQYNFVRNKMADSSWEVVAITAFVNENAGQGRALFADLRPDDRFLRTDVVVVPAGMLWKIVPRQEAGVDLRYWDYPIEPETVPRTAHRARGHWSYVKPDGTVGMRPEPYEDRLFLPLLWSKARLADAMLPSAPAEALKLYDRVFAAYPDAAQEARLVYHRAVALYSLGRPAQALPVLEQLLALKPPADLAVFAHFYLGEVKKGLGRKEEARRHYEEALRLDPPPALRQALDQQMRNP